jgi:hypothetical protein
MSLLPRVRQACSPFRKEAVPGDLRLPDPTEEANLVLVSGTIVEEPARDKGRGGEPITVLLIAFPAPDDNARREVACCEVEILDDIADSHRRRLTIGKRLVVLGRLTGAGGLWATALVSQRSRPGSS